DAQVAGVGDVDVAGVVDGQRLRREQLPGTRALAADRAGGRRRAAVEDHDAAAARVEDEAVAGLVEGDRDRVGQDRRARVRRAPDRGDRPVRVDQLHAAVDGV